MNLIIKEQMTTESWSSLKGAIVGILQNMVTWEAGRSGLSEKVNKDNQNLRSLDRQLAKPQELEIGSDDGE